MRAALVLLACAGSARAETPRYVDAARFHDEAVTIGAFSLGGTLSLPAGRGPFPAVVLVHGSGPNDRDETIGSTKMFRDLAGGLASAGIAVLRYDKRTFAYAERFTGALTLDTEIVDDAVAAVKLVAARPEIDPARVVVIGHSLGGLLAPEIALRAGGVRGVALLAPPGRAPWDIVLSQLRYLHAPAATLRTVERAIASIDVGGTPDLLGIPFAYWRDWADRDGVAAVRALGRPVLVLRGDRDYQVLDADIATWRDGLAGVKQAGFATFSGDNHVFVIGRGVPSPADYEREGHVDARVVARLIGFVTTSR